jgi:hypothetical protein
MLCNAIPSFDVMVKIWRDLQASLGHPFSDIIDEGIDKLNAYHHRTELVPAYTISMCTSHNLAHIACCYDLMITLWLPSFKSIHEASAYPTWKTWRG